MYIHMHIHIHTHDKAGFLARREEVLIFTLVVYGGIIRSNKKVVFHLGIGT